MRRQATILVLALALGACSDSLDGPEVVGVWRVTAHTENNAGCTVGAAVTDPPFIEFSKENILGVEYLTYASCTDAATCQDPGFLGYQFTTAVTDGYEGRGHSAIPGNPECALGASFSQLLVRSGTMTIENRTYGTTEVLSEPQCTLDEARRRDQAGSLPCLSFESFTAVRN